MSTAEIAVKPLQWRRFNGAYYAETTGPDGKADRVYWIRRDGQQWDLSWYNDLDNPDDHEGTDRYQRPTPFTGIADAKGRAHVWHVYRTRNLAARAACQSSTGGSPS